MNITEFLEARIAEDEKLATYYGSLALGTARVLAECAAKQEIMDLHSGDNDTRCQSWNGNFIYEPCETLRALAAVYADHPDYQQEWAV